MYPQHRELVLGEVPFTYKDIFEVMRLQEELVEAVEHIKPLVSARKQC